MHDVRRVKTTEDKMREKRQASMEKAKQYTELLDVFNEMKGKGEVSEEVLSLNTKLIGMATENYTFWNYRKVIVQQLVPGLSLEEAKEFFSKELSWVKQLLMYHHKSYWCWFHRKWIADLSMSLDETIMNWEREIDLCTYALSKDIRNFHCWNYRRYAANRGGISRESELEYTLSKVEENFSNYSAWHQRSYLLPLIFPGDSFLEVINDEFELVRNAFYVKPDDQSGWFYHSWLIGIVKDRFSDKLESRLREELEVCTELIELEPDCKWPKLTALRLMKDLNERGEEYESLLTQLIEIDPPRKVYYSAVYQTTV